MNHDIDDDIDEKLHERRVRQLAYRWGFRLVKAKGATRGSRCYQLINVDLEVVVLGAAFDATLEEIEALVREGRIIRDVTMARIALRDSLARHAKLQATTRFPLLNGPEPSPTVQ